MDRVLLIVNSRAGSVSPRTKEVIVKALSADFKLEVADTTARGHASDLASDAVGDGFTAVIAFGGDGTINEVAQGIVGTDVALGVIAGGTTNVLVRSLGMPTDPVDGTAYVAERLRSQAWRRIHVGRQNERYFILSAGMGLDAEVVKRVEEDPDAKRCNSDRTFLTNALKAAFTGYRGAKPQITLEVESHPPERVLLAVCCNGRPFTYYKRLPVDACPRATLDGGLDLLALKRIHATTIPRIVWSLFVSRSHINWRIATYHHDIKGARLTSDVPLPIQVDGDYLGETSSVDLALVPEALNLVT